MRINFLSRLFGFSSPKKVVNETSAIVMKKAEEKLQSRLTDWHTLMRDVHSGDILEISTGKKFTGKFAIKSEKLGLEQLYHIKDGKISFMLLRDKNANNYSATRFFTDSSKSKLLRDDSSVDYGRIIGVQRKADEQMRDQFVMKELMKSGKDSIVINGNI